MHYVIITRHAALVDYLREIGFADAEVIPHATPEQIRGRHVVGPLPIHLAALAASVTHVPLDIPAPLRGVELTIEQVRQYAGAVSTFVVVPASGSAGIDLPYLEATYGSVRAAMETTL